jgi:hypothetical protein
VPINKLQLVTPETTVTSAGALSPVSVASITGDYTIKLYISSFTGLYGNARVAVEESVNAFSNTYELWVQNVVSAVPVEGVLLSYRKREAAGTDLVGTESSELRVNVQELNAMSPSLTFSAWVEY